MTVRIYVLNSYQEHGPENMTATRDRSVLPAIIAKVWHYAASEYLQEVYARLPVALLEADSEPGISIDILDGWGGLQITVLDVE